MPDEAQATSANPADNPPPPAPTPPAAEATTDAASTTDKAKLPRPPRKPAAAQPAQLSRRTTVLLVVAAVALAIGVAWVVVQMAMPLVEGNQPTLAEEFEDRNNNYAIRRPVTWVIEDRHDGANIYIKGPRERGFPPLIIVSLDIKPGGIESYLREHKGRIAYQDKTVAWISEDTDYIDGCPNTVRLEYECNATLNDDSVVRVRALQFIMEDKPRFYRVTCFVSAELYEKYLSKFEACARSFRRTPIPKATPQQLQ